MFLLLRSAITQISASAMCSERKYKPRKRNLNHVLSLR
jgi:hypothetical protein